MDDIGHYVGGPYDKVALEVYSKYMTVEGTSKPVLYAIINKVVGRFEEYTRIL